MDFRLLSRLALRERWAQWLGYDEANLAARLDLAHLVQRSWPRSKSIAYI
ncbi:MAG: hypothetical protein ACI9G1_004547 [Pirellulaceae bacterium]|jgi:hypothetical protein